jgi:hypothetical protein
VEQQKIQQQARMDRRFMITLMIAPSAHQESTTTTPRLRATNVPEVGMLHLGKTQTLMPV